MTLTEIVLIAALALQVPTRAEEARSVAELAVVGPACDVAGYAPKSGTIEGVQQAFIARWEALGSTPGDAAGVLDDAVRTQVARMEAVVMARSDSNPSEQNRREGMIFRDFVLSACLRSSQAFPEAFDPSENAGRIFYGWMGLWLDYPLIEEAEFYLMARGSCAGFTEPYDARAAADVIASALPGQPASAVADVRQKLVSSYRDGQNTRPRLDRVQCSRLMPTADLAFRKAWREHAGAAGLRIPL